MRSLTLIAAVMAMGLVSGVFALYAHTIMPGLARTDDRTFIAAFQSLDRAIINPWFMAGAFLGALVFTLLAAFANLGRPALPWIAVALLLYLVAVATTFAIHLPLNDAIKAAGDAQQLPDPGAVRRNFQESRWAAWNLLRVATSVAALACLCCALLVHGQTRE